MLQPAPHARLAVSNEDLIVLDLDADRYLGLPGAISSDGIVIALPQGLVLMHPRAAEALASSGLLIDGDLPSGQAIGVPDRVIDHGADSSAGRIFLRDVIDLLVALVITGWRLWRNQTCARHETSRLPPETPIAPVVLCDQLARLGRLRLFLPTPRRCLPSALVTCVWLGRKGVKTEIVFGVRTHPFEAHCWAEHGGIVLDDTLDRIRTFVPISVGVP